MSYKAECEKAERDAAHLRDCLRMAVPLWVAELKRRGLSADELVNRAHAAGDTLAYHGDALMFVRRQKAKRRRGSQNGTHPPSTAEVFSHLAEGLACMALLIPDGEQEVMRVIERLGRIRDMLKQI